MAVTPVNISPKDVIETVNQFNNSDFEDFFNQILNIRAKRIAPSLNETETELFQQINKGLSSVERRQLQTLSDKLFTETISTEEYNNYMKLSAKMEKLNVERLQAISKLAIIKNKGLKEMMVDLGLK